MRTTKLNTSVTSLEAGLRKYYGASFDEKFTEAKKTAKTLLGAYNALNRVTEDSVILEGAYLGHATRKNKKGTVSSAWFKVLDGAGRVRSIYLHDQEFAEKLPEEPPKLSGTRWTGLQKSIIISTPRGESSVSYRTTPKATFVVDDDVEFGMPELTTFKTAVEERKQVPQGGREPFFTVLGEIANVNVGADQEKGTKWIRAEIEDTDGTRMTTNLDSNLRDLFGEQDWLDDYEEVAQNLYHMPVLLNGRVYLFETQDGQQRQSFVIKGVGWIADVTKLPAKFQAKLETAVFGK